MYLALSNASLRPHHPGGWLGVGVPTFPNMEAGSTGGSGGWGLVVRLSIYRVSGVLCLLPRENIVYSYHPNSE